MRGRNNSSPMPTNKLPLRSSTVTSPDFRVLMSSIGERLPRCPNHVGGNVSDQTTVETKFQVQVSGLESKVESFAKLHFCSSPAIFMTANFQRPPQLTLAMLRIVLSALFFCLPLAALAQPPATPDGPALPPEAAAASWKLPAGFKSHPLRRRAGHHATHRLQFRSRPRLGHRKFLVSHLESRRHRQRPYHDPRRHRQRRQA